MADQSVPRPGTPDATRADDTTSPTSAAQTSPTGTAAAASLPPTTATREEPGPTEHLIGQPAPGSGPFEREREVMSEGVATRDDISVTQTTPTATRDVSSTHIARLFYQPIAVSGGPVYQSQALEERLRVRRP